MHIKISQGKNMQKNPGKLPNVEFPLFSPQRVKIFFPGIAMWSMHRVLPTREAYLNLGIPSLYWALSHKPYWLPRGYLSFQLFRRYSWFHVTQSPYPQSQCWCGSKPHYYIGHDSQANKDLPITYSKILDACFPEAKTKGQTFLLARWTCLRHTW